ncbi:MAG: NAD-dependent epimerase/dehydratase family protein [Nanoarchaeota archaeon]|nr:NAD-dependent epimerase/dehydratase family protein [Nanoarchaeota archaeon]
MKNILITGNKGFIGSHLMKQLGNEVMGIDNNFHPSKNKVESIIGDIRNKELVDELVQKVDVVFHLAAVIHVDYSIKYPADTLDVNIGGTLNILEACRKYNKKLIFASSSEVYGSSQAEYMNEEHLLDCQSPYAATKVAGDRLCKSYMDTYGMDISILRNFNTFGEWQNDGSYGGVIAIFTRQALAGKPITVFGDGSQERDYMHINDAIRGYVLAASMKGVLNIGTGKTVSVLEIAKMIKEITESKSEIVFLGERAGEVQRLCADISKAKKLGFEPRTDFKKNLIDYVNWYKRQ